MAGANRAHLVLTPLRFRPRPPFPQDKIYQDMLWFVRVGVLAAVLLFSLITLGVSAAFISDINGLSNGFFTVNVPDYANLALAISVITLVVLGPMFVIDFIRGGAVTSWIVVELSVTGVLMILWLATAADAASASSGESVNCNLVSGESESLCRDYQAIEAFSFLNWIFLMGYFGTLLVVALRAHSRGNNVWRGSVRETDFSAGATGTNVPMVQQSGPVA
ncbi:hypothetical protein M0805_007313 [Coniferiporia weirii]|nr:hypothetical protein M0805_007313 [Coniferiporia weirii]